MQRMIEVSLRARALWAPLAIAGAVTAMGCQSFAPVGGLTAKGREQKIIKQAANDPFPSPGDVGLGEKTKTL